IYEREERKYTERVRDADYTPSRAESFYHALLFALIWASRTPTTAENHSYWGRSDIEAEKNGHRYVVELKVADGKEAAEKAADEAMRQIREKGYADRYKENRKSVRGSATLESTTLGSTTRGSTTLIGLAVDRSARRVGGYRIEKL
ncbi:MAG: PD-(D/E)XK nuclease domain-containing protein, partial [Synergistaceae bacterium]|nr:PD-(D/E)XK nuclease domain-containing protein [Synergistaceae bacterium]